MKKTYGFIVAVVFVFIGLGFQVHAASLVTSLVGNVSVSGQGAGTTTAALSATSSGVVNVGGQANVNAGANNGGLAAEIQSGGVVSLDSVSPALIETDTDLTAYDDLVVKSRPSITAVNEESDGTIAVAYVEPAKFLGIFPSSVSSEVDVDATGNATVHSPWWGFLYAKDDAAVQTSVAAALQQSGAQFGAQADTATSVQNQARVINAVSAAIQAQVSASSTASAY